MNYNVQLKLQSDLNYIRYLRENSHWYKILNRNQYMFDKMVEEMKEKYKLRVSDKLDKISTGLDLLSLFIDTK